MTDFSKLIGAPVVDESLEAFDVSPEGFMNGSGEQLTLTMHPINGTRYKKAVRKMQIKVSRAEKDADKEGELTEAELDEAIDKADLNTSELMARMCDGWNLTDGKAPIEFSFKGATDMFAAVEPLRDAVDKVITERGKKLKAKKSA